VTIQYLIGVDYFSDDLSIARTGGKVFHTFFGDACIDVSHILKFILQHRCSNSLRDGNHAEESGQCCRVFMGCCGQAYTEETIQGNKVPKAVYGVNIFNEIEDVEECTSLKAMIADMLDCMQQLFDYIKAKKLANLLPFNDQPHLEHFAIPFWKELGAAIF
jgi:hypothetical protein